MRVDMLKEYVYFASQYVTSFKSKKPKEEYPELAEWFLIGIEELDQNRVVEFVEILRGQFKRACILVFKVNQ